MFWRKKNLFIEIPVFEEEMKIQNNNPLWNKERVSRIIKNPHRSLEILKDEEIEELTNIVNKYKTS